MDTRLVEARVTELRDRLRSMADPARQSGVQRFFKDKVKSLGIRTPVLRKLSQEYVKAHRRSLDLDDALAIGDRLIRCELLEEKAMAVLLAERFAGRLRPAHFAVFDRWIDYADNWATIDAICSIAIGKIVLRNGPPMDDLLAWAGDCNLWRRRAAAVSLVVSARRGMYLAESFRVADKLMGDGEDMVQKGVGSSWRCATPRRSFRRSAGGREVLGYRPG